jgi:glycosyltransferase involved in cell wall biosynthesis
MIPITIVIPVYNEEKGVEKVINELKNILIQHNIPNEIVTVNDGSTDNSRKVLSEIKDIVKINHPYNKGYGASLKTGIKKAKYDYICIIDADGTYPVTEIPKMYSYINEYDMIVGARIGTNVDIPFAKKYAKKFITMLANYLVGRKIPDLNSGLRIFKKDIALANLNILPSGFSFTTTITCATLSGDYFVKYHKIDYHERIGESKIRPFHAFEFSLLVLRLMIYFKPLKIFLPFSFLIIFGGILRTLQTIIFRGKIHELSIMLLMTGLMFLFIGLMADMFVKSRNIK